MDWIEAYYEEYGELLKEPNILSLFHLSFPYETECVSNT